MTVRNFSHFKKKSGDLQGTPPLKIVSKLTQKNKKVMQTYGKHLKWPILTLALHFTFPKTMSTLTLCLPVTSADNPLQTVGPNLDSNCLTLMVFLKFF